MNFPASLATLSLLILLCSSCRRDDSTVNKEDNQPNSEDADEIVARVIKNEQAVQRLTPEFSEIAAKFSSAEFTSLPDGAQSIHIPNGQWSDVSIGTLASRFEGDLFILKTKLEGLVTLPDGKLKGIQTKQYLTWTNVDSENPELIAWEFIEKNEIESSGTYFTDITAKAIPSSYTRSKLQRSTHQEITEEALAEKRLVMPKREYADIPDLESAYQYPSVSVVDYDSDGKDDLFVTARYTDPQLLKNKGDGTFEDVTLEAGLACGHCVNFTLFADFDNDGDPDALVCRSLEPCLYLQNNGGRFENVTHNLSDLGEQFFVTSASARDVNRDGLLDIYLCTYTPGEDVLPIWKERHLRPGEAEELNRLAKDAHPYFDDRGGPNVLLINRGNGRLERAESTPTKLWRKSYQAAWADLDRDGDDDLYVCNDFAPDTYLRNDTPKGAKDPIFVDAYAETFRDGAMAFGMGASFADYDNDGDLDLFVSNMYSKAGNRIINLVGKVDPRIKVAARGNFLYRNDDGRMTQVAEADAAETKTGWSFGGQFSDFNNDGKLDLYIPSGYYTAPKRVATEVDL